MSSLPSGNPVEAETDGGPADVKEVDADDAEERCELAPRELGAAPYEHGDGGDKEPEGEPRASDADGYAPDVEARDQDDEDGETNRGGDEPTPRTPSRGRRALTTAWPIKVR